MGRFIVVEPLGAGAMGEVVLAYDPDLDRRVAVKVLRPHLFGDSGSGVQRMLREARAMAKVSHPNVITVFEVDQAPGGQSFIAMEYVDGDTLRAWLDGEPTWRQVLSTYTAAGAGLAAAHDEGLVHRDFKPDNVLIDRDGRVRVTDFGLVAAIDEPTDTEDLDATSSDARRLAPAWDVTLTRSGSMMGTPAYMAPEDTKSLDARSDQFSFCVALYEALYGERPFAGDTLAVLRANVCRGDRRPVPTDRDVPRWLREVVERGLHVEPTARWPDMHALLRALRRSPEASRGRWLFGGVAVALTTGAVALAASAQNEQTPPCPDDPSRTAELWNEARSTRLRDAFQAASPDDAADGHAAVVTAMDTFVEAWLAGYQDTCEAHRVRGEQSAELFDRRMLCLQRRLERTDSLLEVFEDPDPGTVGAATRIQGSMPSVDTCADTEAMMSMVPPPDASQVRTAWKQLHLELDHADALGVAGKHPASIEAYAAMRSRVETLDHPPQLARYLQNYGNALIRMGKFTEAIEVLAGAPEAAARADDARVEANVWLLLARAYGMGLDDAASGAWLARMAEVAAIRSSDEPTTRVGILYTQAILADQAGRYAQGLRAAKATVEASEAVFGRNHRNTSAAWGTLGNAYDHAGDLDQAQFAHETSLEIDRGLHDGPHPDIGHSLVNLGLLDEQRGNLDQAWARYEGALQIYEQTVGKTHSAYGTALLNLAGVAAARGETAEARRRYDEVLDVYRETAVPEGHADYGTVYVNLAGVALRAQELDEAHAQARRGLKIRLDALGPDHPKVMLAQAMLGRVLAARREFDAAEVALRDALRIADASLPEAHPDRIDPTITLGQVLGETGRADEGAALLKLALEQAEGTTRLRAQKALAALTP